MNPAKLPDADYQKIADRFLKQLLDDIEHDRLSLPTLPEVAIRIREVVEDPDTNTNTLAKIISTDTALTARLLQVANSPLMRGSKEIENINQAITRLGNMMVRNLVTTLVMAQLYQASTSKVVKQYLRNSWLHNTMVAAISSVFARKFTKLKPDEAMLAGLIHDIGSLPILIRAETIPELINNAHALQWVIFQLHTRIGQAILKKWNFSQEMVDVVSQHENLARDKTPTPDLVDVVLIANLHSHIGTEHFHAQNQWENIPAFKKLGLSPDASIKALEEAREEVQLIQKILA